MDYFKRIQQERKKVGIGGWYCTCCDIASDNHKKQRQNKKRVRRHARRYDKCQLKTKFEDVE